MMEKQIQSVNIIHCGYCFQHHNGLIVKELASCDYNYQKHNRNNCKYYTICPTTLEPIFIDTIASTQEHSAIDYLAKVQEFHEKFNHPILAQPTIPDLGRCTLRFNLIKEETLEFQKAFNEQNIIDVADSFADIMYVLSGAILEFGLQHKFADIFAEVHRSNMSKLCSSEEEANQTVVHYVNNYNMNAADIVIKKMADNQFHVMRASDGKTLKNINYSKADLAQFFK